MKRPISETAATQAKAGLKAPHSQRAVAKSSVERQSIDRRAVILQVATECFAKHGFEATTIRQIADGVNILSGSLYYHFDTKEDILNEIVSPATANLLFNTKRIFESEVDPERKLLSLILFSIGVLTKEQGVHAILYNERRFLRANPSFAHIAKSREEIYRYWKAILEDGIRNRLFREDLDSFLTISTIMRILNSTADWFNSDESYTLSQVSRFQLKFILSGIRTPERILEELPIDESAKLAAAS